MIQFKNGVSIGVGPFNHPTAVEIIDANEYRGEIGDIIRIGPSILVEVQKIVVAIHGARSGLIEHGQAQRDPVTGDWVYTATATFPGREDRRIVIAAVAAPGQEGTLINIALSKDREYIECVCAGERRSALVLLPARRRRFKTRPVHTFTTNNSSVPPENPSSCTHA
jgi:hypothetical protein